MADSQDARDYVNFDPFAWYAKLIKDGGFWSTAGATTCTALTFLNPLFGIPAAVGWITTAVALGLTQTQINVPANPKTKGIPTYFGRRSLKLVGSGDYYYFPWWPLQMGVINVPMGQRTHTFPVECQVRLKEGASGGAARSGGAVEAKISISWTPDDKDDKETGIPRIFEYVDAGGLHVYTDDERGEFVEFLEGRLKEAVRTVLGQLSWTEALFMRDRTSAILIARITGEPIKKIRRGDHGLPVDRRGAISLDESTYVEEGDWSTHDLIFGCEKAEDTVGLINDVTRYLEKVASGNYADVHNLGLRLIHLNVEKITPLGGLKEAAEGAAREQAEGEALAIEQDRLQKRVQRMVDESKGTLTYKDALEACLLLDKKLTRNIDDRRVTIDTTRAGNTPAIVQAAVTLGTDRRNN